MSVMTLGGAGRIEGVGWWCWVLAGEVGVLVGCCCLM